MKFFNIEFGKRKVSEQYQRGTGSFVSRWARPPSLNTAEWMDMFSKSPRLAVVDRIASDLANLQGHLFRINPDGSETELMGHRFLDFMAQPNPLYEMTSSAIWRLHEVYLMLVGESFMLIERDAKGYPVELWNVPPHWVKMTPYLGNPTYQIISPSGVSVNVSVDDMFVAKQLNPLDPFMRGLGIAESIADEVEIDEYAAQFQKRFFYNDATPSLVFLMPDATQEQRDAFMARWNQRHKGVENSHRATALSGKVTIQEFGDAHGKDIGFIESRIALRDAVLEHFGVPRELMGITENSNRATADSAQYIYAKNVLTPRIQNREEAINKQLLPLFGDSLVWRYEPVIPYDKEFDKAKALDAYQAGLITKNEARNLMDLAAVAGGDVFKTSANEMFLKEGEDPAMVTQALFQEDTILPVDTANAKGAKSRRRVNITTMLRKKDAALRENEQRFETAIAKYFAEQRSTIAKALGMTTKAAGTDALASLDDYLLPDGTFDPELWEMLTGTEQQKLSESVAAGLLNWREEAQKLTAMFTPLWKMAYEDGEKVGAESYGLIDIIRPEFISPAKINGGKRIVGIQETTKKNIANIIAQGIANGSSQNSLRKEILAEMGPGTTRTRAKLIARQETSMALATGQFDMMKAAGATTKTWHHRDQKDPRDGKHGKVDHIKLEAEKDIAIDERFSNGLRYPQDPECDLPEEVINCHCYLTYGGF